jgi:hypothetical protein
VSHRAATQHGASRLHDLAVGELAALDRRGFLRALGALAAAGLLPAGCARAPEGAGPPPDLALRHLTPRTYATLNAAAARIVGPDGAALVAAGRIDPGREAERFLAGAPALAPALRQALLVLEFGVRPLLPKWRPFTALGGADRDAVLAGLAASRLALLRRLFAGVKAISLMGFYGAPASHEAIGYPLGAAGPGPTIADALRWDERSAPRSRFSPPRAGG